MKTILDMHLGARARNIALAVVGVATLVAAIADAVAKSTGVGGALIAAVSLIVASPIGNAKE
jgi:hypothetical protein